MGGIHNLTSNCLHSNILATPIGKGNLKVAMQKCCYKEIKNEHIYDKHEAEIWNCLNSNVLATAMLIAEYF